MNVSSFKRRLPRILGLATAALALAAVPAASASADILPIPTPVIVPAPIQAPGSGRFAWPEQVHTITQGFGCTNVRRAPTSSQCPSGHFHTGLDIAGPNLVDVHAADTGVARIFPGTTGYGNYIIITHGNGYSTL